MSETTSGVQYTFDGYFGDGGQQARIMAFYGGSDIPAADAYVIALAEAIKSVTPPSGFSLNWTLQRDEQSHEYAYANLGVTPPVFE